MLQKQILINFPLSIGNFSDFVDNIIGLAIKKKSSFVCVANVHMFIEAYQKKEFREVVNKADLITPDGLPLIWALNRLYRIKQERVSGMDLLPALLDSMSQRGIAAYFYGGSTFLIDNTNNYLKLKYPNLKVAGLFSPPFTFKNEIADDKVIQAINKSGPLIVFVILGCPKQEKWMNMMKDRINTVMIGIGGALPVMVGLKKRAPAWMQKCGLEWFFRLSQEPSRLFKRYWRTNILFLWIYFKELFKKQIKFFSKK